MTKPWQLAPWLAVAALAASAWWWQTGKDAWRAPTARMPELPVVAELPSPPVFHAQQALERPLLWTSRRPTGAGEPKLVGVDASHAWCSARAIPKAEWPRS